MVIQRLRNWIKSRKMLSTFTKSYYYLRYIRKYAREKIHTPTEIFIETTNLCNSKCEMCPHGKMQREKGRMSWEVFEKIIKECKSFQEKIKFFALVDIGEPLLDHLLFKRIEYIKKNLINPKVILTSNAALLDEDKSRQILSLGVDKIIFSVDGASKETYENIRIGLNYDIVKRNIERFFELKKENINRTEAIMQMVVGEDNKHQIEDYKKLWMDKADAVHIKARHSFLDIGKSIKTKELKRMQLGFCEQPYEILLIYWNGDVGLCCWDYDNVANLGNIQNDSLIKIYNSDKFKIIRAAINKMDCSAITPCNKCAIIYGYDNCRLFKWEGVFHSEG